MALNQKRTFFLAPSSYPHIYPLHARPWLEHSTQIKPRISPRCVILYPCRGPEMAANKRVRFVVGGLDRETVRVQSVLASLLLAVLCTALTRRLFLIGSRSRLSSMHRCARKPKRPEFISRLKEKKKLTSFRPIGTCSRRSRRAR